jgi:hypothetical protein
MWSDDEIIEAAQAIRPYLAELGVTDGPRFDSQIADVIAGVSEGRLKIDKLFLLLTSRDEIREWCRHFLENKHPPAVTRLLASAGSNLHPIRFEKFGCPKGDYIWFRASLGEPLPSCPTHPALRLVPAKRV